MNEFGIYRVSGTRNYRGHPTGSEFMAKLDPLAEQRAIGRGDIVLIDRVTPELPPTFSLPRGWITEPTEAGKE